MKAGDFKPCAFCGKGVMHTGIPLFYRVKIERLGIKGGEVQRAAGMEQFMGGNVALARVFHDPDLTQVVMDEITVLVCETCSTEPHHLAMAIESEVQREVQRENTVNKN